MYRENTYSPVGFSLPKEKYNFTPEQQRLIDKYHSYIFVWLYKKNLDPSEYYDVVVFGFLSGIQNYNPNHLRANITSLLWCEMRKAVYSYKLFENRSCRRSLRGYMPIDPVDEHGHVFSYPNADTYNLEKHVELRILIDKMLSGDIFNPIQTAFIKYIIFGYSEHKAICKISRQTKKSHEEIKWQIETMRIMLKSYVRYGV